MLGKRKRLDTFEDLDEAIQSSNIKFIVGPEKKEYTVHESRFTSLSSPLRALLTGGFQESKEGKVIWGDTDPVTFVVLVQYAYNGDCLLPAPDEDDETPEDGDTAGKLPRSMKSYINAAKHRGSQHGFVNDKLFLGQSP
ncbi:hypothetical protein SGCOL_005701 [Colletotrichum sp. CLE4]